MEMMMRKMLRPCRAPGVSACTRRRWVPGACSGRSVAMTPRPCSARRAKGLPPSCSSSEKRVRAPRALPGARRRTSRPAGTPRGSGSRTWRSTAGPSAPQSGAQWLKHTLHPRDTAGHQGAAKGAQNTAPAGAALYGPPTTPQDGSPRAGASPVAVGAGGVLAAGSSARVEAELARGAPQRALPALIHVCKRSRGG